MEIDFGSEKRQILTGMAQHKTPEEFIGKQMPFILNLEPRKMMGLESQAMILAVNDDVNFALLKPTKEIKQGSPLK